MTHAGELTPHHTTTKEFTVTTHHASVRPGIVGPGEPGHRIFEGNYVVECSCGDSIQVSGSEASAEQACRDHIRTNHGVPTMIHDTDPTPPHGIVRPTKTHALDRQLMHLRNQATILSGRIAQANDTIRLSTVERNLASAQLDIVIDDINTTEQLLCDLFPEPTD